MSLEAALSRQAQSSTWDRAGPERDQIARLVDRIDCRRADSHAEREAIFRLRYQAYMRDGTISPNVAGTFSDPYDEKGNVYLFGLYIDDSLASSIRLHIASAAHRESPTVEVFSDILQPELDAGKVIVDPTRFVVDDKFSRLNRGLPYATIRICMLATEYFNADFALAAVRAEHQAFYRRAFNHRLVSEPRPYPLLATPISLMAVHLPTAREQLYRRYPFFRSTLAERRELFERDSALPAPAAGASARPHENPAAAVKCAVACAK